TRVEGWTFESDRARAALCDQLRAISLAGFGLDASPSAVSAAGALVAYVRTTQRGPLAHVRSLSLRIAADALLIDPVTLRHLSVIDGADGGRAGSLLDTLDRTITTMGG